MKVKAQIDQSQINDMDLSITLTMRVSEWRTIMLDLSGTYPSGKVANNIAKVLGHVTQSTDTTFAVD